MKIIKLKTNAALLLLLLTISCNQQGLGTPNQPKNTEKQNSAYNQAGDIVKDDILKAFALQPGKISASAAAKKVSDNKSSVSILTFEEKKVIAYDDEKGTFVIRLKGKKSGSPFDKTFSFSNFTHPYGSVPFAMYGSGENSYKLVFDEAMEENLKLDDFLKKANANISAYLKNLSFRLENRQEIRMGDHDSYKLTATLEKEGDKIKIKPEYTVFFYKYDGSSKTQQEKKDFSNFHRSADTLKTPYFSEEDLFAYIINKTDENFIVAQPDKFASEFYGLAKGTTTTPGGLFDMTQIEKYRSLYEKEGGYLQLHIEAAINNPGGGGLVADDYTGTLEADYYVSTRDKIEAKSGAGKGNSKKVQKSGFKIVDKSETEKFFSFTVVMYEHKKNKQAWLNKEFKGYGFVRPNNEETGYVLTNPLKKEKNGGTENPFYLDMGNMLPEEFFPSNDPICLVTSREGKLKLFVESITLDKKRDEAELAISCKFKGEGEPITVFVKPFLGHGSAQNG